MFVKKNILGVGISNITRQEVLEYIVRNLKKKGKKLFIVTPNPEILVMANSDFRYKKVLNSANLASADGIGVILAGKFLGKNLKGRVPGVDLVEMLCERIAKQPITVSFLGGGPKIAEMAAECLRQKYPGLKVAFVGQNPPQNLEKLASNILFVAFGSPKQEFWIADNFKNLPVGIAIGVGGAFDFISGHVRRAPALVRALGLEWLYRLITEPWRWKRQLALFKFIFLVVGERLS